MGLQLQLQCHQLVTSQVLRVAGVRYDHHIAEDEFEFKVRGSTLEIAWSVASSVTRI